MTDLEKILKSAKGVTAHRAWATENSLIEKTETVNDETISYFVGGKNLAIDWHKAGEEAPNSEFYVNRVFGEKDAGCSLIISEVWDEDLRKHMAYAEIIENRSYVLGVTENNIIDSMKAAVETVPKNRLERFVEQALETYESDVRFFEEFPDSVDLNLPDLENTVEYLKDLYKSIKSE